MLPKPRSDHQALCSSTLHLDKKSADNTRIWDTLQIYVAHHPSLMITNTGKSIQKGQDYHVLQDLFSFLKFETQVFPEPSCSNTYSGFLLLSINLSFMEIEPKVWRLCLSFHEASEEACRSFSQGMNSKAPARTSPTEANVSIHGTQSSDLPATHPRWEFPWNLPDCTGVWDLLGCCTLLMSSGCPGRQICKISTSFPCFSGAAINTQIQKYHEILGS